MRSRVIGLVAVFFGIAVAAGAQIQGDPSEMNGPGDPAKDAKLVAVPPVPQTDQQQFEQSVRDIHFDFDKSDLRPEDRAILETNAEWLKAHPEMMIRLAGYADERGDIIYNLVLSGERAATVKDALVEMGVSPDRIVFATGWGKLYPTCSQSDESCWSQNRRTHFSTWPPVEGEQQIAIASQP